MKRQHPMFRQWRELVNGSAFAALVLAAAALTPLAGCPSTVPPSSDAVAAPAPYDMSAALHDLLTSGPQDLASPPPDLLESDLKDNDYPPGPYAQSGNVNLGDVLPDFTFQGYWNPTATTGLVNANNAPFVEITMGMLHDSGAKYALLILSSYWCDSCLANVKLLWYEAPYLISHGALFFQILVEGETHGTAATRTNLDAWIANVPMPYSAALDSVAPQPGMEAFFQVSQDQFILIDLKTMAPIEVITGDPLQAVKRLKSLLGGPTDGGTQDM